MAEKRPEKIGIIGSDKTASQWAILYASGGHQIVIYDTEQERLDKALQDIKQELKTLTDGGEIDENTESQLFGLIQGTVILSEAVKDAVLLQECLADDINRQVNIFKEVNEILDNKYNGPICLTNDFARTQFVQNFKNYRKVVITRVEIFSYFLPLMVITELPHTYKYFVDTARNKMKLLGQEAIAYVEGKIMNDESQLKKSNETVDISLEEVYHPQEIVSTMPNNEYETKLRSLNTEQKDIFDVISAKIDTVVNNKNDVTQVLHSIHGGIGTGKTYLLKLLVERIKRTYPSNDDPVAVAAYTGSAAFQISGTTLHSHFYLSLIRNNKVIQIPYKSNEVEEKWRNREWLVIDEISMVHYENMKTIDSRLQEFKNNSKLYGGINVLVFGDKMAIPPTGNNRSSASLSREDIENESKLWDKFSYSELSINERQKTDPEFIDLLNNLRFGKLTLEQVKMLRERRKIYSTRQFDDHITRIFPHKNDVNNYNNRMTNKLSQTHRVYRIRAADTLILSTNTERMDIEYDDDASLLNEIELAIGSRIMLRKDISIVNGLVHGAMGLVQKFSWSADDQQRAGELPLTVWIKFDDDTIGKHCKDDDGCVAICPVKCIYRTSDDKTIQRTMLPFILCWALTIHKSQGLTLDEIVTDLKKVFGCGQAYSALGRVRRLENVVLLGLNIENVMWHNQDSEAEVKRLRRENPSPSPAKKRSV